MEINYESISKKALIYSDRCYEKVNVGEVLLGVTGGDDKEGRTV